MSISIINTPGRTGEVSVDIDTICNRDVLQSRTKKYMAKGWDWNLFSNVIVAHFTGGVRRGQEFLLDGQHRRQMFKEAFPEEETIPAYIIDVENEQEYHLIFAKLNWENRKQANAEEVFIHKAHGGDETAIQLVKDLNFCGLSVYGSPDIYGTVGDMNGPNVKIGAFKRALRNGHDQAKMAASIISRAWPGDKVQGELLEGISILYKEYPSLSDGSKVQRDFEAWFTNYVSINSQYLTARDYKNAGGAVHHRHGASIAKGILEHYRSVELKGIDGCSKKWKQKMLPIRRINKLLEK